MAWSRDRKPDPKTGMLPPVGNTVNVAEATYTNNIGSTQLSAARTDPDFDPSQHAMYENACNRRDNLLEGLLTFCRLSFSELASIGLRSGILCANRSAGPCI